MERSFTPCVIRMLGTELGLGLPDGTLAGASLCILDVCSTSGLSRAWRELSDFARKGIVGDGFTGWIDVHFGSISTLKLSEHHS
jgi:hypothetical protein